MEALVCRPALRLDGDGETILRLELEAGLSRALIGGLRVEATPMRTVLSLPELLDWSSRRGSSDKAASISS